jgi:hypothetical protein
MGTPMRAAYQSHPEVVMTRYRFLAAAVIVGVAGSPAPAQESASFDQREHVMHAGGRPSQGTIATSASFRVTLDAVGSPAGSRVALIGATFRSTAGFVAGLVPSWEVDNLQFLDVDSLVWSPSSGVGDYAIYRGTLSALGGATWGACLSFGSAIPEASDATPVPPGTAFGYLVAARNRLREEATLGSTSSGARRLASTSCP